MELWLNGVSEWWLFALVVVSLQGAGELGLWLGRTAPRQPEVKAEVSAMLGAVLGLLALLLGFTFAMAAQRFEARKELVRDEANAIGTVGLRIQLLPPAQQARTKLLLKSYVDTRFTMQRTGFALDKLRETHVRSVQLQEQLWKEAVTAAQVAPDSEMTSLFVSALNEMFDLHGSQVAAIRNRVPGAIFALLFLVAIVSLGLAGYNLAPRRRLSVALTMVLTLLVSSVVLLIVDLHRPARGLVTVNLASLEETRDSL